MALTFEWFGTETAPADYPAYIVSAYFELPDGAVEGVPDNRITNNGWGEEGSSQIIGDTRKAAPVALNVTWYDFIADKGYAGHFALPHDRLVALMRSGAPAEDEPGKRLGFQSLIVGLAPGGDVALWAGAERVDRLVGMYQAQPANIALDQMSKDPTLSKAQFVDKMLANTMPAERLAAVRGKPVPEGLWRRLDTRFAWLPHVVGIAAGDLLWLRFANGEHDWFDLGGKRRPNTSSPLGALAVPARAELTWSNAAGQKFLGEVQFDPEETLQAFQTIAAEAKGAPMQLLVEPGDIGDRIAISLRAGEAIYAFRRAQSSIMPN